MSNLLLTTEGTLKIADFGLARPYHSSMQPMTPSVVTLWYRAPELLFGAKEYTTSIDTWSAGCIFGELLLGRPLMPGRTEMQQICLIIDVLGTPNDKIWPEFRSLPLAKKFTLPSQAYNNLRLNLPKVSSNTIELINGFLTYDPRRRLSARRALYHPYFDEPPLAQDPSMLPTFPEVRNMTTSEMARLRMQINKETRGANNLT
ncbi:hypothetical protein EV182_004104 [Spiromyces aspiralis]|uniref:Uncharacterized protein n=1 Tax=Spiromyces aspiralis TaxID=68401 RepID=A0ACC1HCG1_9FUNG|nr:hypothetical protein EV182_004104 [Spiromyces aspiralis]